MSRTHILLSFIFYLTVSLLTYFLYFYFYISFIFCLYILSFLLLHSFYMVFAVVYWSILHIFVWQCDEFIPISGRHVYSQISGSVLWENIFWTEFRKHSVRLFPIGYYYSFSLLNKIFCVYWRHWCSLHICWAGAKWGFCLIQLSLRRVLPCYG